MSDITLFPSGYELVLSEDGKSIGFRAHVTDMPNVTSVIFPFTIDGAVEAGAMLIAHADFLAGRPERDWRSLGVDLYAE